MKTFARRKLRIEETKEALPYSREGSTGDKWAALNRKRLGIVEMPLALRDPFDLASDPLVALETALGEAAFVFEVVLAAAKICSHPMMLRFRYSEQFRGIGSAVTC